MARNVTVHCDNHGLSITPDCDTRPTPTDHADHRREHATGYENVFNRPVLCHTATGANVELFACVHRNEHKKQPPGSESGGRSRRNAIHGVPTLYHYRREHMASTAL